MTSTPNATDISFERLLRHAAGEPDDIIDRALAESRELRNVYEKVSRMVRIKRRAGPRPVATNSNWLERRVIDATPSDAAAAPSLKLVFDSFAANALALRSTSTRDIRFLRYDGEFSVEIQVKPDGRGAELRGQISPCDATSGGILIPQGCIEHEFAVAEDGTFRLSCLNGDAVDIDFGPARIVDLPL